MAGNIWWIGPVVLVASRLLYGQARASRASNSGSELSFRATPAVRIILGFAISVSFVVLVKSIGHEEPWVIALGTALFVLLCLGWPSTITVDQYRLTRQIWWKRKSAIDWDSVADLERGPDGDVTVYGANGNVINFSRYHTDPDRFEAEVLRHSKLRQPSHPDSSPSINLTGQ